MSSRRSLSKRVFATMLAISLTTIAVFAFALTIFMQQRLVQSSSEALANEARIVAASLNTAPSHLSMLRRGGMSNRPAPETLSVGGIELSPSHRVVRVEGQELKLTLRELDLLEYLMRKPGVVFTRESLLRGVWGWDFDGGSRTVDVHVQTLRQKLGDYADRIETVRGVGYRLADL